MKNKVKFLLCMMILILMLLVANVQADSFKFSLSANKSKLDAGQTVEITLSLADINAGDLGINTVEGILEYDSNVFEEVTQSSFQSLNNWSITYNNEETEQKGKILAVIIQSGVKEDQNIGKLTLKVKNNVQYTNTTVKIKNIASNNGQNLIPEEDKAISFEVGKKPVVSPTSGNNQGGNNQESTGSSSTGLNNQNANMSTGKLPQTGLIYTVYIVGIIALIAVAVYAYIRFRKVDK